MVVWALLGLPAMVLLAVLLRPVFETAVFRHAVRDRNSRRDAHGMGCADGLDLPKAGQDGVRNGEGRAALETPGGSAGLVELV
jgi:hypothetical protein